MIYSELMITLADLLQYTINDATTAAPFNEDSANKMLKGMMDYSNLRICRDMNFLAMQRQDVTKTFVVGQRLLVLPTTIIAVSGVAYITPAGVAPSLGTIKRLDPVTVDWLDSMYPTEATTGPMKWYALLDNNDILVGPSPAAAYKAQITGDIIPDPMSSVNPTTYIGTNFPELLVSSCMIFGAGFERDYGMQADDPKMAVSWESQYKTLLVGAMAEERRRKQIGQGWTDPPAATRN